VLDDKQSSEEIGREERIDVCGVFDRREQAVMVCRLQRAALSIAWDHTLLR
jgi:hypothetical protein